MLTLELRWFVPGSIADRELRGFADDGRVEVRTDAYQLGTGETIGVKRRGAAGLLEHKQREAQAAVTIIAEPEPLHAVAERWRKTWPERGQRLPDASWANIGKRRALRNVGGCRAELTALDVPALGPPWLTLAVETAKVDALDSLLEAASTLLRAHASLARTFAAAESCGYPAWIDHHGARWGSNPQPTG